MKVKVDTLKRESDHLVRFKITPTAIFALFFAIVCFPLPAAAEEKSSDEIARELANPNTPLASLTLKNQLRFFAGELPHAGDQSSYTFLFQPSFPMTLNKAKTEDGVVKDMLFFRPAFPLIVGQPVFDATKADFDSVTGMGDIGFDLMLGRSYPSGLVVGAGIVTSLPTGRKNLSSRTWTLGPEAVVASINKWGVAAIRSTHEWNVGGSEDVPTSITSVQTYLVFLPGGGWSVGTTPEFTYDWKNSQWTVPLNLSASKTLKVGNIPVKLGGSIDYFVEHRDDFAPRWVFSLNITPVVPNVIAQWLGLD